MEYPYDNSQIKTYQTCPMKYFLKYQCKLRKQGSDSISLVFGSAVHKALEMHNLQQQYTEKFDEFEDELARTNEGLALLVDGYKERFLFELSQEIVVVVEAPLVFKLGQYDFMVKPDLVYRHGDEFYSRDYKTTSSIRENYFSTFFINSQISAQIYAVKHEYGQCSGVCIDVLCVRFLKRKSKIRDAGFNCEYDRSFINRTEEELVQWKYNMIQWIERIEHSIETNNWPKASGGFVCNSLLNKCEFRELCKKSTCVEIDSTAKELYYEEHNPYEYMGLDT